MTVLVDRTGVPLKYRVDYSDNPALNEAAVNAVMGTRFKPGVQFGKTIRLWVIVPIVFKLNN